MMSFFQVHFKGKYANDLTPQAYAQKVEDGEYIVLIDVRSAFEYHQKRIPNAIHYPIELILKQIEEDYPDKYQTYVLYCNEGILSYQALEHMRKLNYTSVYDLGGIQTWPYETDSDL